MHFLSLASLALVASGASAISIPRAHVHHARIDAVKPATYAEGYLELYSTYHSRYLALDCESQHGKPFFDECCHPMLATETLAKNRAPQCNPANLVSSSASVASHSATASSALPSATQLLSTGDGDDDDCDDEDDESTSTAASAAPSATADDDDEDCDDEDDESSSVAPSTTHASSTHASPIAAPATAPATTSQAPATTSKAPVTTHVSSTPLPKTTETHSATPSSTHTPTSTKATASPTSTSSSDNGPFTGNATFYFQHNTAGACGAVNPDSAFIAAMQTERYGNLAAKSSLCGQQVQITNKNNGKTVTVTIADACPTCGGPNDIDLSQGAFDQIATEEEGEVPITWKFL
ncbi:RlpA-like double-psi beta-barrel-protein domain-containing protein-containing protein [Lenzites betulinus]|nr:RlpA-like double-psi beta-barrel-protein domain-containing protein-containing protein [Lenzites betulinus]